MKTAVSMQNIINRLALKHHFDLNSSEAHLRLEQDGFMPLVIEKIGLHQVSIVHYYRQNGDTIADPDVVFFTEYGDWIPIQITQPLFGVSDTARLSSDGSAIESYKPKAQAGLATFCRTWASNLSTQRWLDATPAEDNDSDRVPNDMAGRRVAREPIVTSR